MTSSQWHSVKKLFERVREAGEGGRQPLLDAIEDAEVRREVESLLKAHDESEGFLETPAAANATATIAELSALGKRVGNYVLQRIAGEGGMGVVYEGARADGVFEQRVAVKMIKRWMLDDEGLSRFRAERQILAGLEHPNIARLIDGGATPDGTPYYVMEFVDGRRLDDYCRREKLDATARLRLFCQVCAAVQYAHDRGIIHRDIKPGNILVTDTGLPKLLDFGIARSAASDTLAQTVTGQRRATPHYASPEQLRGEATTAATDVYSLGVVLKELLNGEPQNRQLDGIVQKAMAPLAGDRYASPQALCDDIGHFIGGRPHRSTTLLALAGAICLLAITAAVLAWMRHTGAPGTIDSIAVLPFADLSAAKDQEYFCDGFTEELISALATTPDLRVVARTSSFMFKGKQADIRDIGRNLNAGAVVEGSVRRNGDSVRITAQLIRTADGYHLWARSYDRKLEDVFAVQEEISQLIAGTLKKQMGTLARSPETLRVSNLQAHDLYLLGRYHWNRFEFGELDQAVKYFQQAIDLDPNSAQAYSGLADAYSYMIDMDFLPTSEVLPKARAAADRAIELNPSSAEAHTARGLVAHELEWDQARARKEFLRAIELNPNYAYGIHWYGHYLEASGHLDQGLAQMQRALAIDPLSRMFTIDTALVHLKMRHYDEAIKGIEKAAELDPDFFLLDAARGMTYAAQKDWPRALAAFRRFRQKMGDTPAVYAALVQAEALSGDVEAARKDLAAMKELAKKTYCASYFFALAEYALNDPVGGRASLQKSLDAHSGLLVWYKTLPVFDQIKADPKGKALVDQVGGVF